MKTTHFAGPLALAVALLVGGSAQAQSLGLKKIRAAGDERLQKKLADLNKTCGTSATFAFDWSSFGDDEDANKIAPIICEDYLKEVTFSFCGPTHDLEQKAIQEKVKKLSCAFIGPNVGQDQASTKAAQKQALSVKGGTATYSYARWAGNKEEFIRKELEKQL